MKTQKYLAYMILISSLFFHVHASNNNDFVQIPEPEYDVLYEIPREEQIVEILNRIKDYFYEQTPYKIINQKTREEITDFTDIHPDAIVDYRPGNFNLWTYEMGVVHSGMFLISEITGDTKFSDYSIRNYNFIFDHLPYFRKQFAKYGFSEGSFRRITRMRTLDHCGAIGAALVHAYKINQDERYRTMIDIVADFISLKQFRLEDGTIARPDPYPESLWTDDFYMCIPFLARMGTLTGDTKYYDDAVKQVLQLSRRLFIWDRKLFDHGMHMHMKNNPNVFWARANGWAIMAIVELLTELPDHYKGRAEIIKILQTQVQGLVELQGSNGIWHNLLDRPDTYLESSASAMFIFAIARAINNGWIDYSYGSIAVTGWNALTTYIKPNGQIGNICCGTGFANDIVYYYNRPISVHAMHGYGPTLLAGAELIQLLKNDKFEIRNRGETFYFHLRAFAE